MTPFCAAIDWGTSSFRLWLMSEAGTVIAERQSDEGMMRAAAIGFDVVLERHLAELGVAEELPVVMCGMVGARQGWQEAGYLDTPADLAAIIGKARKIIDAYPRDVRVLPGIAQREAGAPDVMRGEETQLLGLVAQGIGKGLVCMPGTHSKWVRLKGGKVDGFSTYMTGELFAMLSRHSILSAAVDQAAAVSADAPGFLDAARTALADPQAVSNLLFQLRAGQLLGFAPPNEGAARLSGLLIGLELAGVAVRHGTLRDVVLVASGGLCDLYRAVLECQDLTVHVCDASEAVRRGLWRAASTFWTAEERQEHAR
ncbi:MULTISPECIES: 2-dehydro-3-deoxygalactonokinase [Rhodomicrobium]|uniref:2-dehydro-3-deoxygalactonokinase n=1 Tax=Rhodomicrobium TaxID=1068 RepID=UPI0024780C5A|nr:MULTISPECIES: 2-dehydro-3-deoxygalactonokinase [Rhodomicrobium]